MLTGCPGSCRGALQLIPRVHVKQFPFWDDLNQLPDRPILRKNVPQFRVKRWDPYARRNCVYEWWHVVACPGTKADRSSEEIIPSRFVKAAWGPDHAGTNCRPFGSIRHAH
jgi:hypothetical protein